MKGHQAIWSIGIGVSVLMIILGSIWLKTTVPLILAGMILLIPSIVGTIKRIRRGV